MKKKKQRRENTRRNVCSQGGSAIAHIYTQHTYTHTSCRKNNRCLHRTREHTHTHTYNTRKLRYTSATNTKTIKTDTYIYIYIWLVGRHRAGQTREFRFRGTRRREEETVSVTRYNNTHIIIRSDDLVKREKAREEDFRAIELFFVGRTGEGRRGG